MPKKQIRVVIDIGTDNQNALFPNSEEAIAAVISSSLMGPGTDCSIYVQEGNKIRCIRPQRRG